MASMAVRTVTSLVYKTLASTPSSTLGSSLSSTSNTLASETMEFAQVVQNCNKFRFNEEQDSLFRFFVLDHDKPVGYILPSFITEMNWNIRGFEIDLDKKTVLLNMDLGPGESIANACDKALVDFCAKNIDKIDRLDLWLQQHHRNDDSPEYHPILGLPPQMSWLKVPSPVRGVFGIVTAGAHMTMYTFKSGHSIPHIWVAKRSPHVTYAGKYDQLAAGAMAPSDGNIPIKTMAREAMEEAGLLVDMETRQVKTKQGERLGNLDAGRLISFYDKKNKIAGSESGQLEPGVRYTFELHVPRWFEPKPCEPDAIEGFQLLSVDEVKRTLKAGGWKPNSALVMLSFLEEKGLLGNGERLSLDVLNSILEYETV